MGFNPPSWAAAPSQAASVTDQTTQQVYNVGQKPYYLIGRDASLSLDVVIDDPAVSRQHAALIHHEDGRIYIIDLASREGVLVNGAKIPPNKPTQLHNGTQFIIGHKTFALTCGSNTSAPAAQQQQNQPVRASHLLVKHRDSRRPSSWKEPTVTRSEEEALAMIEAFRVQLMAADNLSETFAELASRESHCGSARAGGDLGWFNKGQMQKTFEDGTYALQVGELSQPIFSDSGVHLILRTG